MTRGAWHRALASAALFALLVPAAPPLASAERQATMTALWERLAEALDRASDAREPPLAPPEPVTLRWQARRISSIGLSAPLLAMAAGDLDGDGRADLVMLTATEVVIVERRGRALAVRASTRLPAAPAPIRPRDPVGALVIADMTGDGRLEIAARSSEQARGAVLALRDGALIELGRLDGFPLCPDVTAELEPGRNDFASLQPGHAALPATTPARLFAARCRRDLRDPDGRPLAVTGVVGVDGTLHLHAARRCQRRDAACREAPDMTHALPGSGVAFAITDANRDGHPEVVVSAAAPPGDPDQLTVLSWRQGRLERVFTRGFSGGVVGLAAGDLDGDGVEDIVAAVRLWGSHRVDLWTFH